MPATRSKLIALCALALSAAAACSAGSTSAAPSAAPSTASASSALSSSALSSSAPASSAPAAIDKAAGCAAVLELNGSQPPGSDPDGPAATPQEIKDWAAAVQPVLTTAADNAPGELAVSFDVLQKAVAAAALGTPVDGNDVAVNTALNTIDASLFDNCGYQTLDLVNAGGGLTGVEATLQAGPTVVRFANSTESTPAAFVLLVARIKDGQSAPLADLESGALDISTVADVLAGAQPTEAGPGYAVADLTSGHYVLAAPLGTPPSFSGMVGAEFDIE